MMENTLYVYDAETRDAIAEIHGERVAIEAYAENHYDVYESHETTYTPAFGAVDGLNDTEREIIHL